MIMVQTVSLHDLYENFNRYADVVSDSGEAIIITRPNGKNLVLISESKYDSWQETIYLLGTQANRQALDESISQLDHSRKALTPAEFERLSSEKQ